MSVLSESATRANVEWVDILDAETHAVAQVLALAQTTVRSMIDDARLLLGQPNPDQGAWSEIESRLVQHRAALATAVARLCPGLAQLSGREGEITTSSVPLPPRPHPAPESDGRRGLDHGRSPALAAAVLSVEIPEPPQPRGWNRQ